jgi:hypothetical protein
MAAQLQKATTKAKATTEADPSGMTNKKAKAKATTKAKAKADHYRMTSQKSNDKGN